MNEMLDSRLWAIIAPLLGLQLILIVTALIGCARAVETRGPKWVWMLIIVFGNVLGPVLFFAAGRRSSR
ncbi:PLD nuclease N-terminal domain-containing protein [Paenibacillus methanolicus]|uniref:Phospholipase D-like protein n=1 Tax=Paenibacillus methanolicus TaxID=582686 RepID=A0A5S5BR39_9BACL|nr:PLD nuclease N-terminal domain-containing protein [Paenibacillus methanolicus]TYP68620.1 phospholipase D-like protein [Paenibacillus methanolicus]